MIKKPIELTMPEKLYRFLIATWCAVVVGVVILCGQQAAQEPASAEPTSQVQHLQGVIQDLHEEVHLLRKELSEHDPESDLLRHYQPD